MQSSVLQSKKPIRTIEDLRTFVLNSISNVDINLQLPPYISTFFHPLRLKVFQNYSPLQESDPEQRKQILYEFVQVLDEEMINLFEMQLSKPYQDLIFSKHYCIPRDFDVPALQGDNKTMIALTTLVGSIAEWNIQIERTVDSFSRVQLYQLWTPDQKVKEIQLNAELKSILSPDNDFNYSNFSKHILLNTLSYGSKKFGDYLSSAGLSQANLSFGAVLLLYHAFVGGAAIPWKVLIPQQNLTWLVGGMLGSFTLGKISTYLDKYDKIEQLYGFAKVFEEITKHLLYFNESINTAVNKCLLSVSKQEELNMRNELKYILEDFLKEPEQIKSGGVEIITIKFITLAQTKSNVAIIKQGGRKPALGEENVNIDPLFQRSDNGSLVFSQFRLNAKGLTLTQNITYLESKYFKDFRLEDFETVCRLGSGQSGMVDKILHRPSQEIYALKKIKYMSNEGQEALLKKELKALIDCKSDYIVQCYGAFYSKGEIYILLEYMDMGSLLVILNKVGKIPESLSMIILQQVLLGIEYLHMQKRIIHRDIKPHNILVNRKGEVRIADFGICSVADNSDQKRSTYIGTTAYMSPERLNGEEYSFDCDIWSVGMMALQCLTGRLPFEFSHDKNMSVIALIQMMKKFDIDDYLQQFNLSEFTNRFISMCLQKNPKDRAKASELLQSKAIKFTEKLNKDQFKNWLQIAIEEL